VARLAGARREAAASAARRTIRRTIRRRYRLLPAPLANLARQPEQEEHQKGDHRQLEDHGGTVSVRSRELGERAGR
jgi:hypothetical protein